MNERMKERKKERKKKRKKERKKALDRKKERKMFLALSDHILKLPALLWHPFTPQGTRTL